MRECQPRVIKFLRSGSSSLSPAEAQLLMNNDGNAVAKFLYTPESMTSKHAHLALTYIDSSAPYSIRKLMQGQRVQWDYYGPSSLALGTGQRSSLPSTFPKFHNHHSASNFATVLTKRAILQTLSSSAPLAGPSSTLPLPTQSTSSLPVPVYRDRGKWSVTIEHMGRLHYLGRYDSEDDAFSVYKRYIDEEDKTGVFVPKKLKKNGDGGGTIAELYATGGLMISFAKADTQNSESGGLGEKVGGDQSSSTNLDSASNAPNHPVYSPVVILSGSGAIAY